MTTGIRSIETGISLLTGQLARASLRLGSPRACQLARSVTFDTARSFIEPTTENKAAFRDLLTRLGNSGTHNRLLITGHTDSGGGGSATGRTSNQSLSERRTQAVQAVLQGNGAQWETLFNTEGWDLPELRIMATEVGETDVNRFRGAAGASARASLYPRYFARLLGGATVPSITATTPPLLGCGQQHLLRGNRTSPSRDTSQPPIEGAFRPNRRSEFFFFDNIPTTIACSEYPTWTTVCSLTPPPPATITVTIAPVDTVRRGSTVDVQVTVNPSPFGTQITLTLSTTSGTGEARFASNVASNNGTTLTITGSGPVTIRGINASSSVDNVRISATVTGRSAVLAQEDFTVLDAVSVFLQFEVFNLTTRTFEPLPTGVNVDLMRDGGTGRVILTRQTTAGGRVFFNLPDLSASGVPNPDIFFLARTNGLRHAGHTVPVDWSTAGWLAADNTTPGLQTGFTGPQLGTLSVPIVFRVGLDFHAKLEYRVDAGARRTNIDPAPPKVPVKLKQERPGFDPELLSLLTDSDGEVHGVSFIARPGTEFYIHVNFEMADPGPSPGIKLERTRITNAAFLTLTWDSKDRDADRTVAPSNQTSIGTQTSPLRFTARINGRNVALYQLKVLRELAVFLFEITLGDWPGVEMQVFPFAPAQAFSFPPGQLNIPAASQWSRSTIIHEMSHQVMWKQSSFSGPDIAVLFTSGVLRACHKDALRSNAVHALIEGWAEFVASAFLGRGTSVSPTRDVEDCTLRIILDPRDPNFPSVCSCASLGIPLGPGGGAPSNQGEIVEGAFANGLLGVFQHQVVGAVSASPSVPERLKEQVVTDAPWVRDAGVRANFLIMIWRPLASLRTAGASTDKTTRRMIASMEGLNPTTFHLLQPELQAFNMAMTVPTVTAINPIAESPAGGIPVTITGTNFTVGTTSVTFNGVAANPASVSVTSSTTLTCTPPPGSLGPADLVVTTPAGSSAAFRGFTYAPVPTVTSVAITGAPAGTAARGPTSGGTPITVTGTDFQPGARVFLGGLPSAGGVEATDVLVTPAAQITARTPLFPLPLHRPGGTAVVVLNPNGLSGSLDPGFDYFLGPAPNITLVDPPTGLPAGGETIVIEGLNFQSGVTATIDGRDANIDRVNTSGIRITALTPARPGTRSTAVVVVEVRNPDGQTAPGGFTYVPLPAPNINFIRPPSGSAAGGDTIVIVGLNFQAGVTVTIDGRNADVDQAGTTTTGITVLTPARLGTTAPTVVTVEVKNPDDQTAPGGFTYTP